MLVPVIWSDTDDRDEFAREMAGLEHELYRFFGNGRGKRAMPSFKTDVVDEGKDLKIQADLPGFDKKDIHLDLKDGSLVIAAKHSDEKNEKNDKGEYLRRERSVSSYERHFAVGKDVKPEDVKASYENGVLTVKVPKKAAIPVSEAATRIAIQ